MSDVMRWARWGVSMLALVMWGCAGDDGNQISEPEVTGTVSGMVTVEGEPIAEVDVSLSAGVSTRTDAGGDYTFTNVEEGSYMVTVSGFPVDVEFDPVSRTATIATEGQVVDLDFDGTVIRTAVIEGTVTLDDAGLEGVPVTLTDSDGEEIDDTDTDADGEYAFDGLEMGGYVVGVSQLPDYTDFEDTELERSVGVGETATADFEGRTTVGIIVGYVELDGTPLESALIVRTDPDTRSIASTDESGIYDFDEVPEGTYDLTIIGPNLTDCTPPSSEVEVVALQTTTQDYACVTLAEQPELAFAFSEDGVVTGPLDPGSSFTIPLLTESEEEVATFEVVTSEAGSFIRESPEDGGRLTVEYPGILRLFPSNNVLHLHFRIRFTVEGSPAPAECRFEFQQWNPAGPRSSTRGVPQASFQTDLMPLPEELVLRLKESSPGSGACDGVSISWTGGQVLN